MFNSFPYSDFHELNLDWILTKIKEFQSWFDNLNVEDEIKAEVDKYFNEVMIQASYNEETETITLSKQLSGDGLHVYDPAKQSIIIGGINNE